MAHLVQLPQRCKLHARVWHPQQKRRHSASPQATHALLSNYSPSRLQHACVFASPCRLRPRPRRLQLDLQSDFYNVEGSNDATRKAACDCACRSLHDGPDVSLSPLLVAASVTPFPPVCFNPPRRAHHRCGAAAFLAVTPNSEQIV